MNSKEYHWNDKRVSKEMWELFSNTRNHLFGESGTHRTPLWEELHSTPHLLSQYETEAIVAYTKATNLHKLLFSMPDDMVTTLRELDNFEKGSVEND
jgi:hypothetical protein